jgi:hypothetical protein
MPASTNRPTISTSGVQKTGPTEEHIKTPGELDKVYSIYRKKGAYSRYKDLLDRLGLLDKWYNYEDQKKKTALKEWCKENSIKFTG